MSEQTEISESARQDADPESVWAVVELMGRVKFAGRLSEVERFGGKLARLDAIQAEGPPVTKFFGAGAVWCITFVTEAVARQAARSSNPAPVQPWDFPKALNSPSEPAAKPVRHFEDGRIERDDLDKRDEHDRYYDF